MFRPLVLVSLFLPIAALANPALDRESLNSMGADVGDALGTAEYCGLDTRTMFTAFAQGLEAFDLHPMDIQAILTTTEQHRQQGRTHASQKLSGKPCPAEASNKIRDSLQTLESAWRQIVQSETGVALKKSGTQASSGQASQTKPPSKQAQNTSNTGLCVKGNRVSVSSGGQWYPAKVLDGPDKMGTCKVSYDGYGANWDEWVSAQRMRAATGTTSPAQQTTQPKQTTTVPIGKYNCYTFDAGQLNYTYTDILIQDSTRYAVGNKSGTYQLSANGKISFTGTLSNATGTFSIKKTGKPQIDLIFNGDPRSSMACSRA